VFAYCLFFFFFILAFSLGLACNSLFFPPFLCVNIIDAMLFYSLVASSTVGVVGGCSGAGRRRKA
jgi:hypothetical protein